MSVRVALQVGAPSLRNAVRGAGLIVPGLFVLGFGFRIASLGWLVVIAGVALSGFAVQCLVMAWRERPSDLLLADTNVRIEGGPHHGFSVERGQIARISLREDVPSLEIGLTDGSARTLAQVEDPGDRSRLEMIRDGLLARAELTDMPEPRQAPVTNRATAFVLLCLAASWPLTAALYHRMDQHNASSTKAMVVLALLPLTVWADGYFVARAWTDERRAGRGRQTRSWRRLVIASAPLLVLIAGAATLIARHARDVASTDAAHGFEVVGGATNASPAATNVHLSITDEDGVSVLRLDGKAIVTSEPGVALSRPSLDPSGTRVVYLQKDTAGGQSARVSFTQRGVQKDADAEVVAEHADFVSWSPTKQQIAYATSDAPVHVGIVPTPFVENAPAANSGFGAEKPVTAAGEWGTDPVWSADGAELAYISYGTEHFGVHQVYVLDSSFDTPARKLTQGDTDCTDLAWSADGWIDFTSRGRRLRVKP